MDDRRRDDDGTTGAMDLRWVVVDADAAFDDGVGVLCLRCGAKDASWVAACVAMDPRSVCVVT